MYDNNNLIMYDNDNDYNNYDNVKHDNEEIKNVVVC